MAEGTRVLSVCCPGLAVSQRSVGGLSRASKFGGQPVQIQALHGHSPALTLQQLTSLCHCFILSELELVSGPGQGSSLQIKWVISCRSRDISSMHRRHLITTSWGWSRLSRWWQRWAHQAFGPTNRLSTTVKESKSKTKKQLWRESICKQYNLQEINFQNMQTIQSKSGQKYSSDISPKKTYRWPTGHGKMLNISNY